MKQYIYKSAVVAEIERIKKEECPTDSYEGRCKLLWFERFLSFIETLEVKEVEEEPVSNDFEEEYDNYTKHILACDVQFKPFTHLHNCAKYFFELGLKAKGE